jgi:hypothetical protein
VTRFAELDRRPRYNASSQIVEAIIAVDGERLLGPIGELLRPADQHDHHRE